MAEQHKILIVEDVLTDLELVTSELKKENISFTYLHVENEFDFVEGLKNFKPDLILSDYNLPQFDGMTALKLTKEISPSTPFIIVTGAINEETAVSCIKSGAEDYIVKGNFKRLGSAVNSAIEKARIKEQNEKAQNQLRESEERFRSIFEHAAVGIIYADLNGEIIRANSRFCEITNYSEDEATNLALKDFIHPDDFERDMRLIRQVIERKIKKFNVDRRCVKKDKSIGWINLSVSLLRDRADNPLYFIGVVKDISDRIDIEQKQNLITRILAILNRPNEWQQLVVDILGQIKDYLKINAITIRLKEGDGYPYVEAIGYDVNNVDDDLGLNFHISDGGEFFANGVAQFKDIFNKVISGDTDSDRNYFTKGGSFWINNVENIISQEPDSELLKVFQNQSVYFKSMALIPLRSGEEIIGLLHLSDKKSGVFNDSLINYFEEIGATIGIAFKRFQSEQKLKESESRFRNLFENTPVSVWEEDFSSVKQFLSELEGVDESNVEEYLNDHPEIVNECVSRIKIVDVNQATIKLHRAKSKKELLENVASTFTDQSYNVLKDELVALVKNVTEMKNEGVVQTLDGEELSVFISWVVVPGHEETFSKVLVSIVDVTEQKKAEAALKESEERFRGLFENATVGIYRTTPSGEIVMVNPCLVSMLGYSSNLDLTETRNVDTGYRNHEARKRFLEILESEGTVYGFEEEWVKKDGTIIWIRESAKAIKDENGDTVYYEGIVEDITNIKKAELDLIDAKEKAEESDKLKSEFLAQISHEIRTPINVMLNFTDLIKEDIENNNLDTVEESFDHIHIGGNRIIRTIDLILNMSDVQTGSYDPNFTSIDVYSEVLVKLEQEFVHAARAKQLELTFKNNTDNSTVKADEYSLYQMFINIIDNAIKYTNTGSIVVSVNRDSKNDLCVEVTDTGIGIAKNFLPKLFEPFVQEEQGYTRKYEGNGLGLALVKKYCEVNGAAITVESKKGEGSTFKVIFQNDVAE